MFVTRWKGGRKGDQIGPIGSPSIYQGFPDMARQARVLELACEGSTRYTSWQCIEGQAPIDHTKHPSRPGARVS